MTSIGRSPEDDTVRGRFENQLARLRREQERLLADLQAGEVHSRHLARSVWRVEEEERRRIARELHDGVGQNLSALRHRIDVAMSLSDEVERNQQLSDALSLCDLALDETRSVARLLRPQILDDLGLEAAVRWLARQCAEAAGCEIDIDISLGTAKLESELCTVAFRVVQEALTNVIRHSRARHVSLRLAVRLDQLHLLVADNGCGCDVEKTISEASHGRGAGVASMSERVKLFGGVFSMVSEPDEGVQVRAQLPIRQAVQS